MCIEEKRQIISEIRTILNRDDNDFIDCSRMYLTLSEYRDENGKAYNEKLDEKSHEYIEEYNKMYDEFENINRSINEDMSIDKLKEIYHEVKKKLGSLTAFNNEIKKCGELPMIRYKERR